MKEIKGQNASHIQTANRNLILKILSQKESCTRVELARLTGLTQASITITMNYLIEAGIVQEVGNVSGKRGRRCIAIALKKEDFKVAAVTMNRTTFSIGLFDIGGKCYEAREVKTDPNEGARRILNRIIESVDQMIQKYEGVYAIGMAVAGPYLRYERRIAVLTESKGWPDIDLVKEMQEAFHLPTFVEHDANAGVMGEWLYGGLEDRDNCIVDVLTGDGIGAGIMDGGKLLFGNNGIAGQFGHISIDVNGPRCLCGNYGCLELYTSTYALMRNAKANLKRYPDSVLNQTEHITCEDIFEGSKTGDVFCVELISELGRNLGYGIVNLINAYDPKYIVIDGLYARFGGELLLSVIKETIEKRVLPEVYKNLSIFYSKLAVYSVLQGAAAIAANKLLSDSEWMMNRRKSDAEIYDEVYGKG